MIFKNIYEYYEYVGVNDKKEKNKRKCFLKFTVACNLNEKIQAAYDKGFNSKTNKDKVAYYDEIAK